MALEWLTSLFQVHWILIFTAIFAFVYQTILKTWWFFENRDVKFVRGSPFFGTLYRSIMSLLSGAEDSKRVYDAFPDQSFIGIYDLGGTPSYMIRDPDLLKQLLISNFDHFQNHNFAFDEESDPLFARSLFSMRDEKWRQMRATMSPAFTGSKMRLMHGLIVDTTNEFVTSIGKDVDGGTNVFEAKALFQRYANDVIANCAFGMRVNSIEDKDNEFFKAGWKLTNFSTLQTLKFFAYISFPALMKLFKVRLFAKEDTDFFRSVLLNNIEQRVKNKIVRNDMIDLLIKVRDGTLSNEKEEDADANKTGFAVVSESNIGKSIEKFKKWTDDDLVAQCFIFFLAGFDTVSLSFSFLVHELAVNPDVQDKLYNEISEVREQLQGGELDYNSLSKMKYMDMVVSESMRRWSPVPLNDRRVTKPFVLEGADGRKVKLNVGDGIWIPNYAIQMDEQNFPNPEKFDPERFSDENKGNIKTGTYMPFGIGPRGCIASRFALMELKTNIFYLLSQFALEKCEKTQDPLQLKPTAANIDSAKGFWFKLRRRQ